jgi:hypothetical protein
MTELEDMKTVREALKERVTEDGSYAKAAKSLSCKKHSFTGELLNMVALGKRNVSSKLARALGYERVVMYWKK